MRKFWALALIASFGWLFAAEHGKGNEHILVDTTNYDIYGLKQIQAIAQWSSEAGSGLGEWFTFLQAEYFAKIFLAIIIIVPLAFLGHYMIVGQRKFHHGKSIQVFSNYNIIVHWCAAVPFVMLCLTGLIMMFGDKLGGGAFVRFARDVHGIATCVFAPFGLLMFLMWFKDSLPKAYDIKWFMIMGGYLSQENRPIPAGKFNAGQKMWFWVATIGGAVMVISGAFLFFQASNLDTLRALAITHNIVGFGIIALLITHIYMAVFAIEGALHSILNGKMGEEEISILHSYYYAELKKQGIA